MNKFQLTRVMDYLDAEYAGIVTRMSPEEKATRAKHWAKELGSLDFDAVMAAVRKLARGQYMPRTAEIIREVEQQPRTGSGSRSTVRIFRDTTGEEILDVRYADGTEWLTGYLRTFPEWMQLKFRWQADPTPENTAAWDACIQREERARGPLMTMEAP